MDTPPKCPNCATAMQHGVVSSGNTIIWAPKVSIFPVLQHDSEWLSAELFAGNRLIGWRCHPCRLVLIDYGNPV